MMCLAPALRRLAADRRGTAALAFGAAFLPLLFVVGSAIDYSRASLVQADLQAATDAAALAAGRSAIEHGRLDNKVQAEQAFYSGFQRPGVAVTVFDVTQDSQRLTIKVEAKVPLGFASILGQDSITLGAGAEIPLEATTVEVALVLDNTGSMNSANKLTELKHAATLLIDTLQNASVVNTYALVAVVPFVTQVNVGASNPQPVWVRIRDPEPDPALQGVTAATWTGCIADRDAPYHARVDLPATEASLYPAVPCANAVAQIMPLTRDFTAARTAITNLVAGGATNTTIGFSWGLNVLTRGAPLGAAAEMPGKFVKKHMVFLTDGDNTQNRYGDNSTGQIDKASEDICADMRTNYPAVTVHTIRLIDGNEALLKKCATNPDSNYHFAESAAELTQVFKDIATQMISVRLAR
jgi:Flp pilus assembly protein TadG